MRMWTVRLRARCRVLSMRAPVPAGPSDVGWDSGDGAAPVAGSISPRGS